MAYSGGVSVPDGSLPDVEVGRFALRTFALRYIRVTDPALRYTGWETVTDLVQRFGWWEEGPNAVVKVWASPSYAKDGDWEDGTCTATCSRGPQVNRKLRQNKLGQNVYTHEAAHQVPDMDCSCGIYGSLSYADLIHQYKRNAHNIVAVVAAEGATVIGDRGLRTAFARVVAYWVGPDPVHIKVAEVQFSGAKRFDSITDMLPAYGLALLPPGVEPDGSGPNWWTEKTGGR